MARQSQRIGTRGECVVERHLRLTGFAMIERVIPPSIVKNGRPIWLRRVSGDFRAVEPGTGRSVLVEVKARNDRLLHSDVRPHQHMALDFHHEAGGLSIIAWHNTATGAVYLLRWPVPGFVPRSSVREPVAPDLIVGYSQELL